MAETKQETKRTVLYLDSDAADLLAQAATPNRRGKYVSNLIRTASQASPPQSDPYSEIGRQVVELVQRVALLQVAPALSPIALTDSAML